MNRKGIGHDAAMWVVLLLALSLVLCYLIWFL